MNFDTYTDHVNDLKSDQFNVELVPAQVIPLLANSIINGRCKDLDDVKKALFYGKPSNRLGLLIESLPDEDIQIHPEDPDLTHAILGIATEAPELLELLAQAYTAKNTIDEVKLKGEVGDLLWYVALLLSSMGWTLEDVMKTNIAKLRLRFPNKFTSKDAIEKNIQTEEDLIRSL